MDWKAIRSVMVKDDFVQRILNFDTDSITPEILKAMEKYTQNPDWDFDKVSPQENVCVLEHPHCYFQRELCSFDSK